MRTRPLNAQGRCELCATVLAASMSKQSYGMFVAAKRRQEPDEAEFEIVYEPEKKKKTYPERVCTVCGKKLIPTHANQIVHVECRKEYDRQRAQEKRDRKRGKK